MTSNQSRTKTPPRASRAAAMIGLAVVAFAGTCWLLSVLLPESDRPLSKRKLALLVEERPDTVFVGSSRIMRHLSPEEFDATMAGRGLSTHSFSYSMPQTAMLEMEFLLEDMFEKVPSGIRLVVIDPEFVSPTMAAHHAETERTTLWHTTPHTVRSSQRALSLDWMPWNNKLGALKTHWKAWWRRVAHYGSLHLEFVGPVSAAYRPFRPQELAREGRGYMSLNKARRTAARRYAQELEARRKLFLSSQAPGWKSTVREFGAAISDEEPCPDLERAAVRRMDRLVRSHGAVPIYLISSGLGFDNRNYLRRLHAQGEIEHLIDLGDPREWPQFYELGRMFDQTHLDEQGALAQTRVVAETIADMMRDGVISPHPVGPGKEGE